MKTYVGFDAPAGRPDVVGVIVARGDSAGVVVLEDASIRDEGPHSAALHAAHAALRHNADAFSVARTSYIDELSCAALRRVCDLPIYRLNVSLPFRYRMERLHCAYSAGVIKHAARFYALDEELRTPDERGWPRNRRDALLNAMEPLLFPRPIAYRL